MAYPYYIELQEQAQNMNKGNFGLWYNKFIPIADFNSCKASDEKGIKDNAVEYYYIKYMQFQKDMINKLLEKKHLDQAGFCDTLSAKYETVSLKAKLKSPLITGIGESHPHEVSMVFDHNMGIPYIPASGMKGIVRFAHTLGLLADIPHGKIQQGKDGKKYFDEEDDWTNVPQLFGTQKSRGCVIFLDAYPEKVPALHIDIMNPHYSDYYGGDTNTTPPADYLNPVPIKFLTVAKDTAFIFRVLVDKKSSELIEKVKAAFKNALTEEGVGAKTAVGYGLFQLIMEDADYSCDKTIQNDRNKDVQAQEEKLIEKFIQKIRILKPTDAGQIGTVINDALEQLTSNEDKKTFARAVKDHMGKAFKKSKAKQKLEPFLR